MSEDTYRSPSFRSLSSINQLRVAVGLPPRTGDEIDTVARTFNALRALKAEHSRRSAVSSSHTEMICAGCTADQIDALLNALDALEGTAVWGKIRKAFKGFGDE